MAVAFFGVIFLLFALLTPFLVYSEFRQLRASYPYASGRLGTTGFLATLGLMVLLFSVSLTLIFPTKETLHIPIWVALFFAFAILGMIPSLFVWNYYRWKKWVAV